MDADHVTALLQTRARAGESVTYSEILNALGYAFSRPKMRALCALLEHVDAGERGAGRPELAVLVVRQSDRLPGQGWWVAEAARGSTYRGQWEGPEAAAWVGQRQAEVFAAWR
ncbi:ribose-phosphate pyrophosphokinase [Glacieibacterium sp.]|uniref:ribose-phosphate pyrophosphokinase n=1 Tax=Glacieibacterium sp. TaxID=2860237 RepID=UPI003B007CC0